MKTRDAAAAGIFIAAGGRRSGSASVIRTHRRLAQEPFSGAPAFAAPAAEGQTGARRRCRGNAGLGWKLVSLPVRQEAFSRQTSLTS